MAAPVARPFDRLYAGHYENLGDDGMSGAEKAVIAVTGGGGRLGQAVIDDLTAHGYAAKSLDFRPHEAACPATVVDLNKYDDVLEALRGCTGVFHLAAYASPYSASADVVFSNNTVSTFNVLEAAANLGMTKTVLAS